MPESEGATINQEIAELEEKLRQKKESLTREGSAESLPSDKEILRDVVKEKIQEHAPAFQPSPPVILPAPPAGQGQTGGPNVSAPSYLAPEMKDRVQELVNMVFNKGLNEAIQKVAKQNDMALLDAFHDVLVDELYKTLVERKKVEEVK